MARKKSAKAKSVDEELQPQVEPAPAPADLPADPSEAPPVETTTPPPEPEPLPKAEDYSFEEKMCVKQIPREDIIRDAAAARGINECDIDFEACSIPNDGRVIVALYGGRKIHVRM